MIVVTLLAVPFAYVAKEARIVEERRQWLQWLVQNRQCECKKKPADNLLHRILGDEDVVLLRNQIYYVPGNKLTDEERRECRRLFPEAELFNFEKR